MRFAALTLFVLALSAPPMQALSGQEPFSEEVFLQTEKSTVVGVGLAMANTLVPTALFLSNPNQGGIYLAYAWLVGPLPGLMYAGNTGRGLLGMGIRAGTGAVLAGAAVATFRSGLSGKEPQGAGAVAVLAAGVTVASWILDMAAIPSSISTSGRSLTVSPVIGARGKQGAQVTLRW